MDITYRVSITGLRDGFSKDQVNSGLANLFKTTTDKLPNFFSQPTYVVKKNLDLDTAKKYQLLIQQQGCECVIEPEQNIDLTFDDLSEPVKNTDQIQNKKIIEKEIKFCRLCGAELPLEAKFCRGCGSKQSENVGTFSQTNIVIKDISGQPKLNPLLQVEDYELDINKSKNQELATPIAALNLNNFNREVNFKKTSRVKFFVTGIFVFAVTGICIGIYASNKSFKTSSSNAPLANQAATPIKETFSDSYHDESVDTVAGKFTIRTFNDSIQRVIFLNERQIEKCQDETCNGEYLTVHKVFSLADRTIVMTSYASGTSCPATYQFLTITKNGNYLKSEDFGNCAELSFGSAVNSGAKIIITLPTQEQNMVGTEVWTYENEKVKGPIKKIKPESNLKSNNPQEITTGDLIKNQVIGEVVKENEKYYLNFDNSATIVNLTSDHREDVHHGDIVDRLEILFRFTENMEFAPNLGRGVFDVSIRCGIARCLILSVESKNTSTKSASYGIPTPFQGNWMDEINCEKLKTGVETDQGAVIDSESIKRYEYDCKLIKNLNSTPEEFAGEYSCSQEGNITNEKIKLKLEPGGKLKGLDAMVLSSCK